MTDPRSGGRRIRRAIGVAAAALVAVGVIALAVSSGDDDGGASAGSGAATPQRGGTLVLAIEERPPGLNLVCCDSLGGTLVASNIYSQLIRLNLEGEPIPDLAESWTISDDGTEYTFELADGATWHDGEPVTADDVVFSFEELVSRAPRSESWMPNVAAFEAPSADTFVIRLKEPFAPLLSILGDPNAQPFIYPKHLWQGEDPEELESERTKPTGSGPFKIDSFEGGEIVLVRNEDYFKPDLPYLDRLVFQISADEAVRNVAFESGETDFLYAYIAPVERASDFRDSDDVQVIEQGLGVATTLFMLMNSEEGPTADRDVRQAIAYAIDRDRIQQRALFGEGGVAHSHLGSTVPFYTNEFDQYQGDDRIERARELLDDAGYPLEDGTRFSVRLANTVGTPTHDRAADLIKSDLEELGIQVQIENLDVSAFLDTVFAKRDFDLALQIFTTGPDPTVSVPPRYRKATIGEAYANAGGYVNRELERLFETEFALDQADREEAWREIQRILMEDLPTLPIFEVPVLQYASADYCDVVATQMGYLGTREYAYKSEGGRCPEPGGAAQ